MALASFILVHYFAYTPRREQCLIPDVIGKICIDHDDDFWADQDYDMCDPDMMMHEMAVDKTYADGYKWTCCDRRPDERRSTTSHHVPRSSQPTAKRQHTSGFQVVNR